MATFAPHPSLRDRVSSLEVVERTGGELTVLPSTHIVLGLQFRGRVRAGETLLSTSGVTGLQRAKRQYGYVGDTGSLLVRFTPQGAACLGVPGRELLDRSIGLEDLLPGSRVRALEGRLLEATTSEARVDVVQAFLRAMPARRDRIVDHCLARLRAPSVTDASIARLAREVGLSERQLERRFSAWVGLSPKRYLSLLRFERAVALAGALRPLSAVAVEAGYYDHSHFVRDFRRYTGVTPSSLLRAAR